MASVDLTITLDRASGAATLRKGDWWQVVPVTGLRAQLDLYRGLWSRLPDRKPAKRGEPGPWAAQYEQSVRALEDAVREVQSWT